MSSSSATRSKIENFDILTKIGSGSFGTVYKVRRKADNVLYVIKNIRIIELSYKEQNDAINECQILAQLVSPYVVKYFDSFIEKGALLIVMEYCNRGDLQNLIKKAKEKEVTCVKETVIWNICLQVMLGLYYIHRKKILHRDLKSANVFLTKEENKSSYSVKIGDLGVAKILDTTTAQANTIVGTPYYLSPELCADKPYGDKSDCWALGVLLYECCTLKHPFDAKNQCALILKIIQSPVKPLARENASPGLSALILWLLNKDPVKRPSIREILSEDIVQTKLQESGLSLPDELSELSTTSTINSMSNRIALGTDDFEHNDRARADSKVGPGLEYDQGREQRDMDRQAQEQRSPERRGSDGSHDSQEKTINNNDHNVGLGYNRDGDVNRGGDGADHKRTADDSLVVEGSGIGGAAGGHGNIGGNLPVHKSKQTSGAGAAASAVRGNRVRGSQIKRQVSDKVIERSRMQAGSGTQQRQERSCYKLEPGDMKDDDTYQPHRAKQYISELEETRRQELENSVYADEPFEEYDDEYYPAEGSAEADDKRRAHRRDSKGGDDDGYADDKIQHDSHDAKLGSTMQSTMRAGQTLHDQQVPGDWNEVWTESRGLIDTQDTQIDDLDGRAVERDRDEFYNSGEMDFHEDSEPPRGQALSDTQFDTNSLLDGIELARTTAVTTLGPNVFAKVYNLVRSLAEVGSNQERKNIVMKELDDTLRGHEPGESSEPNLEGVFQVRLLVAMESKYEAAVGQVPSLSEPQYHRK